MKTRTVYMLRYHYPGGKTMLGTERVWPTYLGALATAARANVATRGRSVTVEHRTEPVPETIATYGGTPWTQVSPYDKATETEGA